MRLALQEAHKGLGSTSPNPPVGAVLVRNGRFIAKGHHLVAGGPHAEVNAIRAADPELTRGATLYVTLEPCSTHGRTPPCVDAIRRAGISRVVAGSVDPNPQNTMTGLKRLKKAGVAVSQGVLEKECDELIRFFRKHVTTGRPYVIAKTGMTLDGRITPANASTGWITGEQARDDVQRLRSTVDAILIGGETLRQDNPRLTLRGDHAKLTRPQPWRVIVTKSGDVPKEAAVFTDEHRDRTKLFHVEHLDSVLDELGGMGVTSVLLECGGRLMAHAFERELVDEVTFYIAPFIGGGERRAVEGRDFQCRLVSPRVESIGTDFRITAAVRYGKNA